MIGIDSWREILNTISKNKLRTFLTGFSVAWGIFMLILLLGAGNGLQNGVKNEFRDDAINSIWISSGQTSIPYKGMKPGRYVRLTNEDYEAIQREIKGVEHITSRFYIRGTVNVSYGAEHGSFNIRSVHPDHKYLEKTNVTKGRFINDLDIAEFRKSAAIGIEVEKALFKGTSGIGKYIKLNNIPFKVVGVFEDQGSEHEQQMIYLPISTAQKAFNGANSISQVMFTVGDATPAEAQTIADAVNTQLSSRHTFSPDDKRAVRINNNVERFQKIINLFAGIEAFVWVIGIFTLLAGLVGISNIMMITVKERTKEIGIRKAIGATPASIIAMILLEGLFITVIFGYIGLVAGIGLLEIVSTILPEGGEVFVNPEVDIRVAITALGVIIGAGLLAGFIPARKAAAIQPIRALRDE